MFTTNVLCRIKCSQTNLNWPTVHVLNPPHSSTHVSLDYYGGGLETASTPLKGPIDRMQSLLRRAESSPSWPHSQLNQHGGGDALLQRLKLLSNLLQSNFHTCQPVQTSYRAFLTNAIQLNWHIDAGVLQCVNVEC